MGKTQSATWFPTREYQPNVTTDYYDDTFNGTGLNYDGFIARFRPTVTVTNTTNITKDNALKVFPNPSNGYVNVTFDKVISEESRLLVYSIDGRLLQSTNLINGFQTLDFTAYAKGQYIIKLITKEKAFIKPIQIF